MAKKKKAKKIPAGKRAIYAAVRQYADYIDQTAEEMWRAGKHVSIVSLYHTVKGPLGFPGHYDFDYADALKEVLREAGWQRPEAPSAAGVLDWSPE